MVFKGGDKTKCWTQKRTNKIEHYNEDKFGEKSSL